MFGLLQAEYLPQYRQDNLYLTHRKHYCGTCKTIGKNYGHKARLFLNFDAVFLAELLSLLNEDDTQSWSKAHQAINQCWVMPKKTKKSPFALEYAAAINVLLAELKVLDNIQDSQKWRWSVLQRIFSKSFRKVKIQFKTWSINLNYIHQLLKEQQVREIRSTVVFSSLAECLAYYGEVTAKITAYLFGEAARLMNRLDLEQKLYDLGYNFGQMIYAIDAFEDVEKDLYKAEFNPISLWYNLDKTISEKQEETSREIIHNYKNKMDQLLLSLSSNQEKVAALSVRLTSSLANKLYPQRFIPKSFGERTKLRWQNAMNYANRVICQQDNWGYRFKKYAVALAVFVAPQSVERLSVESTGTVGMHWWALLGSMFVALGVGFGIEYGREKGKKKGKKKEKLKGRKRSNPCQRDCQRKCQSAATTCMIFCFSVVAAILCMIGIGFFIGGGFTPAWILWGIGLGLFVFACISVAANAYNSDRCRLDTFFYINGISLLISLIVGFVLIGIGILAHGIILTVLAALGIGTAILLYVVTN